MRLSFWGRGGSFSETGTLFNFNFTETNPVTLAKTAVTAHGLNGQNDAIVSASPPTAISFSHWGLFATFQAGGFASGSGFTVTSLNVQLWGDAGNNDTVSGSGVLSDNGTPDILLATGSIVGIGQAGLTDVKGPFLNANTTLVPCTGLGTPDPACKLNELGAPGFFQSPIVFNVDLENAFNTPTSGITPDPTKSTGPFTLSGGGAFDFVSPIPEPATVALFGISLLGLAGLRRRKS